ncbi:unnamed protein product, partial [Symbiodinium necroappetens]
MGRWRSARPPNTGGGASGASGSGAQTGHGHGPPPGRWRSRQGAAASEDARQASHVAGDRHAAWLSRVSVDSSLGQLTINMSKLALNDEDIRDWCRWFRHHLPRHKHSQNLQYAHIDFAEN